MILSDIVTNVRILINDTDTGSPYRISDAAMISTANQVMGRMCNIRPDLFENIAVLSTTSFYPYIYAPQDSVRVMEVLTSMDVSTSTVKYMREVNYDFFAEAMSRSFKYGHPIEWARHPRNPNLVFVYPVPSTPFNITFEYVKEPAILTDLSDVIDLPSSYAPVLIDGMVWQLEAVDDEHVNSQRAKFFMDSFMNGLSVSSASRLITDTETSGLPKADVT